MARLLLILTTLSIACAADHENMVHVIAEQAPGLKKNAPVRYRGVDVGHVKQVYFTSGGVRIDLVIDRSDVPIRAQDTVRIVSVGPLEQQVIDIQPGVQTAPLIARGATLPKAQAESTVSMPVSAWRALVRLVGLKADSAASDSAAKQR